MRSSKGPLIANPGGVGLPAYRDVHPYPHVIESGSPDARYAIVEKLAETWVTFLIAVPYAHMNMARLAHERGRDDWAHALASGYMV